MALSEPSEYCTSAELQKRKTLKTCRKMRQIYAKNSFFSCFIQINLMTEIQVPWKYFLTHKGELPLDVKVT